MKIVFTGGGTAGHIMPNIALINSLDATDKVWYFGGDGMEKFLVPQKTEKVDYCEFSAPKFKRSFSASNFLLPFRLCNSVLVCKKKLKAINPDIVFSKGGYISLPVVFAANSLQIPVVIHESDLSAGLANKLCAKRSQAVLTTFESTVLPNSKHVGCPLRKELYFADKNKGLSTMGFDGKKPILLFLGGSLGAAQLNNLAKAVFDKLKRKFDLFVVAGKGKNDFDDTPQIHSAEFVDNIFDCIKASAICVTRGGGNTLCELTALNLPFVVIPLKTGSRGEQLQNAEYFEKKGCGICASADVTPDMLCSHINTLFCKAPLFRFSQKKLSIDGRIDTLKIIRSLIGAD